MRILFCIGSMNKGGAERVIANLANFLIKENEVGIAITINDTPKYELNKDINFFTLDKKDECSNNIISRNIKRLKSLKNIISTFNPNIIISFLPEPSYRVLLLRKLNKIPVIVSVRNDPKIEYKSKLSKLIMKMLYPIADGFVFQTDEAKSYFSKKIQKKSTIIPNPINEEFLCKRFNGVRKKKIVTVGRLENQKNHFLLIDAFKEIVAEKKDYKLYIYGDGNKKQDISNYIKEEKLDDCIKLKGNVSNIKEEIYDAKCFVLSSIYEGMPNALMEAMALGIPCISTDCSCGGPRFLIDNYSNGILIKNNCKEELIIALKKMIEDDEFSNNCGINSNKKMKEFTVDNINKKWIDYIKKICKNYEGVI